MKKKMRINNGLFATLKASGILFGLSILVCNVPLKADLSSVASKAYDVFSTPGSSVADRKVALDEVFAEATRLVELKGPEAIDGLRSLSDQLPADSVELSRKLSKAIEIAQIVFDAENNILLKLGSKEGLQSEDAVNQLKRDALRYKAQAEAMVQIYSAFFDESRSKRHQSDGLSAEQIEAIVAAVDSLGFFYIKGAQTVSNWGISEELEKQLERYQENNDKIEESVVQKVILEEYGKPASELFIDFDASKPISTGTTGQVYICKMRHKGKVIPVIVKVQNPNAEKELDQNRIHNQVIFKAGELISKDLEWTMRFLAIVVHNFENSLAGELDYRIEAKNIKRFTALLKFEKGVVLPEVIEPMVRKRVLVQTVVPGMNIAALLKSQGDTGYSTLSVESRKKLFSRALDILLLQLFGLKAMHADSHPGNVLAGIDGTLGLIDWGATVETEGLLSVPMWFLVGILRGDSSQVANALAKLGHLDESAARELKKTIQTVFQSENIKSISWAQFVMAMKNQTIGEYFENLAVLPNLGKALVQSKYPFPPEYVQLVRGMAPLLSTLWRLQKGIPEEDRNAIVLDRLKKTIPKAHVLGVGLKARTSVRDRVKGGVDRLREKLHLSPRI